mmetsp:Transcript_17954/g.41897  ORF Transcript_17954/g.41897 Transcript_17954/m.41897 type:complete len:353 (+) Transcript_17954:149-1207(+)
MTVAGFAPRVLEEMRDGWLQCLDEDGVFYYNERTQQASVALPLELGGLAEAEQVKLASTVQHQAKPLNTDSSAAAAPAAPPVKAPKKSVIKKRDNPVVKLQLGDWMVCEDESGEYFFDAATQTALSTPPEAFVQLYEEFQALEEKRLELEKVRSEREGLESRIATSVEMSTSPPAPAAAGAPAAAKPAVPVASVFEFPTHVHSPGTSASSSTARAASPSTQLTQADGKQRKRIVPTEQAPTQRRQVQVHSVQPASSRVVTSRRVEPVRSQLAAPAPRVTQRASSPLQEQPLRRCASERAPLRVDRVRSLDPAKTCTGQPMASAVRSYTPRVRVQSSSAAAGGMPQLSARRRT